MMFVLMFFFKSFYLNVLNSTAFCLITLVSLGLSCKKARMVIMMMIIVMTMMMMITVLVSAEEY